MSRDAMEAHQFLPDHPQVLAIAPRSPLAEFSGVSLILKVITRPLAAKSAMQRCHRTIVFEFVLQNPSSHWQKRVPISQPQRPISELLCFRYALDVAAFDLLYDESSCTIDAGYLVVRREGPIEDDREFGSPMPMLSPGDYCARTRKPPRSPALNMNGNGPPALPFNDLLPALVSLPTIRCFHIHPYAPPFLSDMENTYAYDCSASEFAKRELDWTSAENAYHGVVDYGVAACAYRFRNGYTFSPPASPPRSPSSSRDPLRQVLNIPESSPQRPTSPRPTPQSQTRSRGLVVGRRFDEEWGDIEVDVHSVVVQNSAADNNGGENTNSSSTLTNSGDASSANDSDASGERVVHATIEDHAINSTLNDAGPTDMDIDAPTNVPAAPVVTSTDAAPIPRTPLRSSPARSASDSLGSPLTPLPSDFLNRFKDGRLSPHALKTYRARASSSPSPTPAVLVVEEDYDGEDEEEEEDVPSSGDEYLPGPQRRRVKKSVNLRPARATSRAMRPPLRIKLVVPSLKRKRGQDDSESDSEDDELEKDSEDEDELNEAQFRQGVESLKTEIEKMWKQLHDFKSSIDKDPSGPLLRWKNTWRKLSHV
ncbi:hypothetical protein C8Q80DRAFT_1121346 [Daedaleopsis nitida]|nr:hypothetical protein C8Q80DRAFT_1121346 [Daedaleopsis nitida]